MKNLLTIEPLSFAELKRFFPAPKWVYSLTDKTVALKAMEYQAWYDYRAERLRNYFR